MAGEKLNVSRRHARRAAIEKTLQFEQNGCEIGNRPRHGRIGSPEQNFELAARDSLRSPTAMIRVIDRPLRESSGARKTLLSQKDSLDSTGRLATEYTEKERRAIAVLVRPNRSSMHGPVPCTAQFSS